MNTDTWIKREIEKKNQISKSFDDDDSIFISIALHRFYISKEGDHR